MQVRVATVEDADDIAALAARTFALACPDHTPAEAIEKHIRTELNADRFRDHMDTAQFLVADAPGGGVCGYAMLLAHPAPIETDWRNPMELRRIYVDASELGSGLAGALMQESLQVANRDGHDWIWLGTNEENLRAIRFYEKAGFRVVGNRTLRVADSVECDYVLARRVALDHG